MQISRLRAYNLRKIRLLDITPTAGINLIWGSNGSGKTTLLEAIHTLHSGKSFRSGRFLDLVTHGEHQLGVRGDVKFQNLENDSALTFKVQKANLSTTIKINDLPITSAAVLAKAFPLLVVEPSSFGILEGGPRVRRSLLDRATFHVEQDFLENSRRYVQALSQRNRLLKTNAKTSQLGFWGEELARFGEEIHLARSRCVKALNSVFFSGTEIDNVLGQIQLNYKQGWKDGLTLNEALRLNLSQEIRSGMTLSGPHKAEIEILVGGGGVARTASRGQIKTVVISIIAGLVHYMFQAIGFRPIILVDDFAAELDDFMCSLTLKMMRETKAQIFLTSINNQFIKDSLFEAEGMFHVEQGVVNARH